MTTDVQARDAINTVVNTAWNASVPAIAGAVGNELRFQGKELPTNPVGYYARVGQSIIGQPIVSMADENTFGNNKRRYETFGLAIVQLFAPKSAVNGFKNGLSIASVVRDAFRSAGQTGEVWYEDAKISSLPDDGASWRWNVTATFRYDEIR